MHRIARKYVTSLLVVPVVVLGVMLGSIAAAPAGATANAKAHLTRASLVSANPADAGTVTASDASFSVSENATLTEAAGTLYQGDSDNDPNPSNQCCTAALYTQATYGTVTLDSPEDGGFTYVPKSGFSGTDSFQYVLSDTDGNVSAPATVTVDVDAVTAADDSYTIAEGQSWSTPAGVLETGATDADGSATCCTASLDASPANGTASVDSNGEFTYTPNSGFTGTDSFTYTLTDSAGNVSAPATVTVGVGDTAVATTTTFTQVTPPAASTTTPVTIAVQVAPASGSGVPTGKVTFTYYTVGLERGGPFTGTLGTATLNSAGVAKITTAPGELPPGGPLNGSITLHATYNGDANDTASNGLINYFVVPGCYEGQWGKRSNGYPSVVAEGSTGYYIGQSNGWYTVYVTQNLTSSLQFTGNVTTNGLFIDISTLKNSGTGFLKLTGQIGTYKLSWKMVDKGDIDGFTFFAGCGSEVKFNLNINKPATPAMTSQIFVGNPTTNGKVAGALTIKRKN